MSKEVVLVAGAGQIGVAIARRIGYGKTIILGDISLENANKMAKVLYEAGFDVVTTQMNIANRQSIQQVIQTAQQYGKIKYFVNAAGLSPSQASIEEILHVDLYGTAILLEEVGQAIAKGGVGVTISSQSAFRLPALTAIEDEALATTPTEQLLHLPFLQPDSVTSTLHAYQIAKYANQKRVMYEALKWAKSGARLNNIAAGIVVTPLAIDEFNSERGDFYKEMFAKSPAGRPATADEIANIAQFLMSEQAQFITGSTFLVDGGATASYFYSNHIAL